MNMLSDVIISDSGLAENNGISTKLLVEIDKVLLKYQSDISQDVIAIYKKFIPMKQDAPVGMKNNLFVTLLNFAKEKSAQGHFAESLLIYRFLIIKSDLFPASYLEIAEILAKLCKSDLATKFIKLYELKETNVPLKLLSVGNFYNLILKDYKSSIDYYEKYLEIDETKPVIYTILGNLYSKVYPDSGLNKQIYYFEKAYKLKPNDRLILHSLAFAYEKQGCNDLAKKYYQLLLQNNPTETDMYNYGAFLIQNGDFINGHKYFTHRFNIDDSNLKYPIDDLARKWDFKTDLSDKILLIHYEQGLGDTFMYCRFVPLMKKIAKRIIFVVQNELFDLVKNSPVISEGIEIISHEADLSKVKFDYHMALLDCPYALGITADNIPYSQGYLEVSQEITKKYRSKFIKNNKNLKIGICTHGDKKANYNGRDIDLSLLDPVLDISGIDFYSFNMDEESNSRVIPLGKSFKTFTDTACALKCMDFVVSTDNVILNLSGALGVKTYGLFNKYPNFRWFELTGDNTGWYKSVKPLQVTDNDCWTPVISRLLKFITSCKK